MSDHHLYGPSSLRRRQLCPGSARMERGLPEKPSADADEGTRLHAVMAGTDPGEWMDAEQRECVEWCRERVNANSSFGWHVERTCELRDRNAILLYGTPDAFRTEHPYGSVVIDYKFGRVETNPVQGNIQMAAYAAMVMQYTGATSCEAHILQPRLRSHDSFVFTDCAGIVATIEGIIAACEAPDAPLVAGAEQCRYCRAALTCPATHWELQRLAMDSRVLCDLSEISDEQLCRLREQGRVAERLIACVDNRIREIIAEKGNCAGLVLQYRAGRRTVTDPQKAFEAVAEMLAAPEFLKCCSVSVSQLESAYVEKTAERTETGRKKQGEERAKKAEFAELLAGLIEQGEPSISIVERKETEQ